MSKKFQLSIPTPCHENWDNMTPVEKGRFCGSCQKQVVDFSKMSDREVAMFFKKPSTGSVCGRFMQDQLDRDIEIPKKRIPWVKYFFQFALPAFLVSAKATAQGKVTKINTTVKKEVCTRTMGMIVTPYKPIKGPSIGDTLLSNNKKDFFQGRIIKGRVIDEENDPVPFASVVIKGTNNGTKTDGDGFFEIKPPKELNNVTIVAYAAGFETSEIQINFQNDTKDTSAIITIEFKVELKTYVTGMPLRASAKQKVEIKPLPSPRPIISEEVPNLFKVIPNPVLSGESINIEWKQSEEGEYILQIFNQAGQLVLNKTMWIDKEARVLNLEVPHVAAGSYFLRMTNKHSGKSYAEKIIVQ